MFVRIIVAFIYIYTQLLVVHAIGMHQMSSPDFTQDREITHSPCSMLDEDSLPKRSICITQTKEVLTDQHIYSSPQSHITKIPISLIGIYTQDTHLYHGDLTLHEYIYTPTAPPRPDIYIDQMLYGSGIVMLL